MYCIRKKSALLKFFCLFRKITYDKLEQSGLENQNWISLKKMEESKGGNFPFSPVDSNC